MATLRIEGGTQTKASICVEGLFGAIIWHRGCHQHLKKWPRGELVVNRPPFGRLLGPTGACCDLGEYMVTYSSVLPACYCLDRRCAFQSLATPSYDRTMDSCFQPLYVHLFAAHNRVDDKNDGALA
jgi:hypothetical protein